jgi:hypothetical protein
VEEVKQPPRRVTTKGGPIPIRELGQKRRVGYLKPQDDWFHVYSYDELRLAMDPTYEKTETLMAARERQRDVDIIDAMFGTVMETDASGNPTVSVPFPDTQVIAAASRDNLHDEEKGRVAASGPLGLTIGKLLTARARLDKSEIIGEPHVALTSDLISHLIASVPGSSADYNQLLALQSGQIDRYLGFKIVLYQSLPETSSLLEVPAWKKKAVQYKERPLVQVTISQRTDERLMPWQLYYATEVGALRRYDKGVVKINCHETRQVA